LLTAEAALRDEEQKPNFSLSLLHIVAAESNPPSIRLASALAFKNYIRRNWTDVQGNYKLPENEVVAIKSELIGLMTSVQPSIQVQLGEAISLIAESDFYERWDSLVDDLVSRLTPNNAVVNNGVLQVAHSIFKRWRPLFRSDELFTEINHVLSKFGRPFLLLLQNTDDAIAAHEKDKAALQQDFSTLNTMMKLFYDLSCQDLPPVFEDNLPGISTVLHKYLTYDNPLLHTDDESESGVLEFVKAGIFEALTLYTQKYEDAFGPHLQQFIGSSWQLTSIGTDTKYDILVSKALQFLTSVAKISQHAQDFNNERTLNEVVEKVILPNLTLRESDVELFEDEPIEFIRRDLEGSDSDTRRRAATDFLRQLMEQFEQLTTTVTQRYIDHYLEDYATHKESNWKSKDTAVYLFSSIAATGATTAAAGVKTLNALVNVLDFFQKHISGDLTRSDAHPILQVDAIKFVHDFRSQFTAHHWREVFPLLVQHLNNSNYVIYTYAAIAVERALYLTSEDKQPIIAREQVTAVSSQLLQHLFKLIQKESAPEKIQENEFLMRCVMRVLIFIRNGVIPITDMVLRNFNNITMVIRHNPSNPRFYYYHFEGIGALIRFAAPSQSEKLENGLYDPFAAILQADVQEFQPYVFQLFAALLESNPSGILSSYYQQLVQPVLLPTLWESKGNVPALVRLLSAIIPRGVQTIMQNNQIEAILGIFQKLIATKSQESHGFDLVESVVAYFPVDTIKGYFTTIVQLMLTRLSNSKTETFGIRFTRFYHLVSALFSKGFGTDFFVSVCDQVQHE
jgi:exportin-2 (importin alpha re-exporter)